MRSAFQNFFPDYYAEHPNLPKEKEKAAFSIMSCKTGDLGYDVSVCEECGKPVIHAVSCNNRNCPCCGTPLSERWIRERNSEMIPRAAYYHVVFTMPHELNDLIRRNLVLLINLFFQCVHETLLTLCADRKFMGAKPGIMSVLHTWGQKLNFHPHIHVCISGGGINPCGKFVETSHKHFFLPEPVIAKMFRGKYLHALKMLYDSGKLDLSDTNSFEDPKEWKDFINTLYDKKWLPFVKETFNGKGNAIEYLARYSYRTAISNSRIVSVDDETVTFRYKDYANDNKEKQLTLQGTDFIALFLQHVLPGRFHRIRFAGFLANCAKTRNLHNIHRQIGSVYTGNPYRSMKMKTLMKVLYNKDICSCPECSGRLIRLPRGMPIGEDLLHSIAMTFAAD